MTRLNSLYVIVHEDGDEMLDIHITTTLDKMLVKAIEHTIALAAIAKKNRNLKMTMIVLIGLLVMCLIITFELDKG